MNSLFTFVQRCINPLWHVIQQALRQWTKPDKRSLLLNAALDLDRTRFEMMLENALVRQQIIILERQSKRPRLSWRDRALLVLLASKLRAWKEVLMIVKPDTILRRHRDLFRWVWRRKSKPKGKRGRPSLNEDIVALLKRMGRHR